MTPDPGAPPGRPSGTSRVVVGLIAALAVVVGLFCIVVVAMLLLWVGLSPLITAAAMAAVVIGALQLLRRLDR